MHFIEMAPSIELDAYILAAEPPLRSLRSNPES